MALLLQAQLWMRGFADRHGRHSVRWLVAWSSGSGMFHTNAMDISNGGAFLRAEDHEMQSLEVGAAVRIKFYIPSGLCLAITGVVRWKGRSGSHKCLGFGIQLDDEVWQRQTSAWQNRPKFTPTSFELPFANVAESSEHPE